MASLKPLLSGQRVKTCHFRVMINGPNRIRIGYRITFTRKQDVRAHFHDTEYIL